MEFEHLLMGHRDEFGLSSTITYMDDLLSLLVKDNKQYQYVTMFRKLYHANSPLTD